MVDEEFVVEEDGVPVVLVAAVGVDFPDYLLGGLRTDFDGEGAVASVGRFLQSSHVRVGLDMPEDGLGSVKHVFAHSGLEVAVETLDFGLGFLLEAVTVGRSG